MPQDNRRTPEFHDKFDRLPENIRDLSRQAFALFQTDPNSPALHRKPLRDSKRSSLEPESWSVRINRKYRSIYVERDGVCIWYWTGSHGDYNRIVGSGG